MNNMNRLFRGVLLAIVGGSLIALFAVVVSSQDPLKELAQESLQDYVRDILTEVNYAEFGFKSLEEAQEAHVGDPLAVMFVGLEQLQVYEPGTGARPWLVDERIFWFPVVVEGQTRTKLEMVELNGEWVAGEFGGIATVERIATALEVLPMLLEERGLAWPDELMLVRIPALRAVFLYLESAGEEFFVPAMVQPERYDLLAEEVYPADELLYRLSEFAQQIEPGKVR